MKLSLGDAAPVKLDDGAVFMVQPVRLPGFAFNVNALVVNSAIQMKAGELLLSAQAMANAKATHCSFLRRSRETLVMGEISSDTAYERAEQQAQEARRRVDVLFTLAKGENTFGQEVVGVDDWRSILFFFHQDASTGAVPTLEG